METVLDYSAGRPSASKIKAAGHAGAVRYLRKKGPSGVKTLTGTEVADFRAHGLLLGLTYEDPERDWMFNGRNIGIDRATWALQQAQAVGIEHPPCIFLCADSHAEPAEVDRVMECLDGARTVLGSATGIYGFVEVIEAAVAGRHAQFFWQCGRRRDVVTGVHLYQRNNEHTAVTGITCDINDVLLDPDWASIGQASSTEEDEFMALFNSIPEFNAAVKAAVRESVQAEFVTVGDPSRVALLDLARRAVAEEFETPGSRTRAALVKLLRNEIESDTGDLHQALKTLLA
jgi:Domain of unknown function (DUF1906)